MTNGLSHPYHLDESTFIFRGIGSVFFFSFLFHFSMKFVSANRIAPDGTPRFAASHLGLFCLHMSHKKDARLIWVNLDLTSKFSATYVKRIQCVCFARRKRTYNLYNLLKYVTNGSSNSSPIEIVTMATSSKYT